MLLMHTGKKTPCNFFKGNVAHTGRKTNVTHVLAKKLVIFRS